MSVLLLSVMLLLSGQAFAEPLQHVVVIWLKQHGDAAARAQYIEASRGLAALPGVLSYQVAEPAVIKRERPNAAVDESYDVAVSASFASRAAYEDFLKNPLYLQPAMQVLRPLVDRYLIYDFGG